MYTETNICLVQNVSSKSSFAKFSWREKPVGNCCRDFRRFLSGVERVKRRVYAHFRCIVNELKKIGLNKMSNLPLPGKISADAHDRNKNLSYEEVKLRR